MSESRLRMIRQQSSSIFSVPSLSQISDLKPRKRITRDFSDKSFTHGSRKQTPTSPYLRPLDHSVQDIFGNFPSDFYRKDIKGIYNSQVIKQKNSDKEFVDKIHNRRSCDFSLKNSDFGIEKENYKEQKEYSSETIRSTILKTSRFTKPKEAKIESIAITGLSQNDDESTIKSLCHGLHIIQIKAETDNFTGKCLGKASIQLRSSENSLDVDKLKTRLIEKGLAISSITSSKGKRNNYHVSGTNFLDSQLQQAEKRLSSNELSSKERKRIILGTSDDLFGNSPGTGKWEKFSENSLNFKENQENIENLRRWEITKNPTTQSPPRMKSISNGYSRPTISSRNKNYSKN